MAFCVAGCSVTEPVDAPASAKPAAVKAAADVMPVGRARETAAAGPGVQAPDGGADRWSSYRDFWFDYDSTRLDATDSSKVSDVANYLRQAPSYRIGIDGPIDSSNPALGERRIGVIRDALIRAGVPENKIFIGAFGNSQLRRDRRVEVLIGVRS